MEKFLIKGPSVLKGKVLISGSKNAALPILASTLLFDKPVILQNLPRVRDIDTMLNLLKSLGSKIEYFDNKKTVRISKTTKPKHDLFTICYEFQQLFTNMLEQIAPAGGPKTKKKREMLFVCIRCSN